MCVDYNNKYSLLVTQAQAQKKGTKKLKIGANSPKIKKIGKNKTYAFGITAQPRSIGIGIGVTDKIRTCKEHFKLRCG